MNQNRNTFSRLRIFFCIVLMMTTLSALCSCSTGETPKESTESARERETKPETFVIDDQILSFLNGKRYADINNGELYSVMYEGTLLHLTEEEFEEYLSEVSEILKNHEVVLTAMLEKTMAGTQKARENNDPNRVRGAWSFDCEKAAYECDFVDEEAFLSDLKEAFLKHKREDTLAK